MKTLSLLVLCFISLTGLYGQQQMEKDFNFILVIDDGIWVSYTNLKVEIYGEKGHVDKEIEAQYYPGNMSFEKGDYEKLLAANSDSMALVIDYKEHGAKKTKDYTFKVPFSSRWLDNYFMIMKIYNLDKKKYKGVFEPLDKDRNYTYELIYPGGQMLRVRNKH